MTYVQTRPLKKKVSQNQSVSSGSLSRQPYVSIPGEMRAITNQTKVLARPTNPWLALTALGFGAFMAILDTSIVNVTLPTLQAQLHTDLTMVSWVLHLYNLFFATCLVTSGRLADMFGRKRFVLLGLLLFTGGSVLCGVSPSIFWLLGARVLQAIGAAILSAVSMALVHTLFPKEQRSLSMGIFGSLNALAAAVGPVIGGILLPHFGWRSIFFVNVPFCLVGFLLVGLFVPEMKSLSEKKRIDVFGLITISLALFSLVLAVIKGSDWGWTSSLILSLFGWAVVGLVLFVFIERRHPSPILDMALFFSPGFSLANGATFLYSVALQGGNLFLSLYFLNARGETQLATAEALLPVALTACIVPNVMSYIGSFITPWLRCLLGICLIALGLLLFCTLTMNSTYLDTMWREIIFGSGIGLCVANFPVVAFADVLPEKLGAASGTLNTFRQVGFVLGIAFLIGIFSGQLKGNVQVARDDTRMMVQTDARLPVELRDAIIAQFFTSDMQTSPSQSDLLQMTDGHPSWQPFRNELAVLSEQIEQAFDTQIVHAYTSIWALAAAFPMVGIGFVIALLIVSRRRSSRAKMQVTAWSTFYFFSLSGGITAKTIQHYLTAQQPSLARYTKQSITPANLPVQEAFLALS